MKRNILKMPVLKMRLLAVLIILALSGTQAVFGEQAVLNAHAAETHPPRVADEADILTDDEEVNLLEQVDEISERQQFDVVIATVESLDGEEIKYYAADYYDYNGYGMGENYDGAMFIISMQEREWYILTTGYGIDVLTDWEMEYMAEDLVPYLSDGDYATAFQMFAEYCDKQLLHEAGEEATDGEGSLAVGENEIVYYDELLEDEDVYYEESTSRSGTPGIVLSVIIGLALAFVPVLIMRGQLKSVHMQSSAGGYEKRGTRKITVQKDIFLYHTVNRVPKPKENRSGGGSSTFKGSSGRSHGGRGGGF